MLKEKLSSKGCDYTLCLSLFTATVGGGGSDPHFAGEETETHGGEVTCPRSYSWGPTQQGWNGNTLISGRAGALSCYPALRTGYPLVPFSMWSSVCQQCGRAQGS